MCNHLGIGLINVTDERKRELALMKMKSEQDLYDPNVNNAYIHTINNYKDEKELKKHGIRVYNIDELCKKSTYWNKHKLYKLFNLINTEMKLIGGGIYTCT